MSDLVSCPNPDCREGHEWEAGQDRCSCPQRKEWEETGPRGVGYWYNAQQHDVVSCETICNCCWGQQEVSREEAEMWLEDHQPEGKQT